MPFSRASILRRVLTQRDLPTLPEVMQRVLEAVENEHSSADDLTRIVEADPVITARLLRLANSPLFAQRHRVDSLQRAVVVLGFEILKQMALATPVIETLRRSPQDIFDPRDFWLHSYGAAKAAYLLAKAEHRDTSSHACFTGALLHDIGKFLLAISLKQEYQRQVAFAARHGLRLCDVEQRHLGLDHAEVGAALLEAWGLPPLLQAGVRYQYQPEDYTGPGQAEVAIIAASGEISRVCGFGNAGDLGPVRLPTFSATQEHIRPASLDAVIQQMPEYLQEARELIEVFQESP